MTWLDWIKLAAIGVAAVFIVLTIKDLRRATRLSKQAAANWARAEADWARAAANWKRAAELTQRVAANLRRAEAEWAQVAELRERRRRGSQS